MNYQKRNFFELVEMLDSEETAIELIWKFKFAEKPFACARCQSQVYYQLRKLPEIRTCKKCDFQNRLRCSTIFQNSKLPLLIWLKAIALMMCSKRGVSALELKRHLQLRNYRTALLILLRIRKALIQRDMLYKLKDFVELDGVVFGHKTPHTQRKVLMAVETKSWVDEQGIKRPRAGFAKIYSVGEKSLNAQDFIDQYFAPNSFVNVDGSSALRNLKNVDVDYQVTGKDRVKLSSWLPWIHRVTVNAKAWINGTHHGVSGKYLDYYLGEFLYRFNRIHAFDSLFDRALFSCVTAHYSPLRGLSA